MRLELRDHAHTGHGAQAESQLRHALALAEAAGMAPRRPLRGLLEPLGVPGFTETQVGLHVLHLRAQDAGEPWFPGVLLREVCHAALSDAGHASHEPALLQASFAAARERSRGIHFLSAVGAMNHHVRDVFAEDLAARLDPEALRPLLAHSAELALRCEGPARAVEVAYARGACERRGWPVPAALPADPTGLAAAFAALPAEPDEQGLADALAAMVALVPEA